MVGIKRSHLSRGFWVSFAVLAVLTIYGLIARLFFIDVLIGLLVIIVGLHGLLYEYNQRILISDRRKIRENFDYIVQWLDNSYTFLKSINSKHESRIHSIDSKRAASEEKIEETFRDVVKKLSETESKLNRAVKAVARDRRHAEVRKRLQRIEKRVDIHLRAMEKEKAEATKKLVQISRRQHQVLAFVRKNGAINSRQYRSAFRATPKASLNDLNEMVGRKLLKRTGKGKATKYTLGF